MLGLFLLLAIIGLVFLVNKTTTQNRAIGQERERIKQLKDLLSVTTGTVSLLEQQVAQEKERSTKVVSQAKSSQVRLGQITEHLAPFLEKFPYNPKDCVFLGMPTDFIVFNLDNDEIIFCEIKSGNAKESPKQKKIKDIIKRNRVFYNKIQINEHGVISTKEEPLELVRQN